MTAERTIAALSALAHEHRLAAYRMLVEAGPNGLSAGLVAERLRIPPSSLTFHLQQLFRADLISQRRASRQIIYAANFGAMNSLIAYLTKNCCGRDQSGGCATVLCNPGAPTIKRRAIPKRKSA
jgi:ArsR family transcriptional regulator, arsenate/arsenite/antimonite-responsive transcriptional repressor